MENVLNSNWVSPWCTGMAAYAELQQEELAQEVNGYKATTHQKFVGTGYFDLKAQVRVIYMYGAGGGYIKKSNTETYSHRLVSVLWPVMRQSVCLCVGQEVISLFTV